VKTIQRRLSEYLQCELYHSLGAYRVCEQLLDDLSGRMRAELGDGLGGDGLGADEASGAVALLELVEIARRHNHQLGWYRYASSARKRPDPTRSRDSVEQDWPTRDPLPDRLPLTDIKRFRVVPGGPSVNASRTAPWSSEAEWDRVPRFYNEAIWVLDSYRDKIGSPDDVYVDDRTDAARCHNLARSLIARRDGTTDFRDRQAAEKRLERRLDRYAHRLTMAVTSIAPSSEEAFGEETGCGDGARFTHHEGFVRQIVTDDLTDGADSLPVFVLRVLAEAHLSMHAVEAWQGMCIGERANMIGPSERKWLNAELDRSIALDTFVFCVSRTAPWLFAKSKKERKRVIADVSSAWENLVPTRCMWISTQIGLLALHRRAYARALRGDPDGSYNDYHKLQHLIRDAERRVRAAPLHVDGALEFLTGLNAEAHHHIGELYRAEHAHKPALEHFKAASYRLESLRNDPIANEVLTNSRWYVELQISHGKACYEMGRHKEALCWHLCALRAFLELLASETETDANVKAITAAIEWLESVKFEPELRKSEISERIQPVVDQLDRITMVGRVGALAAEILLRLGHLLFVLNVGRLDPADIGEPRSEAARERVARERIKGTLAFACLSKARECNPYSTLVGADLFKTRFRFNHWMEGPLPREYQDLLDVPDFEPIERHWPRGGDDYEQLARVAEYLMLKARKRRFEDDTSCEDEQERDALLARDLLLDLFKSTDSINVRKSQIHRFLMKPKLAKSLPGAHRTPAIEFVCMRRYSSPFPLLPRPSAFRALGGGYFVRLHGEDAGGSSKPYGIVVDPGVDFVENLYRSGYSLSDIDMIVVSHDHVDHLGALDPLLSLLHVRAELLSKEEPPESALADGRRVKVLMSESVHRRYKGVTRLVSKSSREFEFERFEKLMDATGKLRSEQFFAGFPQEFEIVAMSSAAGTENEDEDGHRDLSNHPSHGFCFRVTGGAGPSVAITSDTPPPPPREARRRYARWRKVWGVALSADILVAHLGSVPLTELRRMDAFEAGEDDNPDVECSRLHEDEQELKRLQGLLQAADEDLKGQIEYAQWLRSHVPKGAPPLEPAALVGPVSSRWLPPPEHNYLAGLLRWAREYAHVRSERRAADAAGGEIAAPEDDGLGREGLFVVGELSEELATMRGKVAVRLNKHIFGSQSGCPDGDDGAAESGPYALTSDIGLQVCVISSVTGPRTEVLCTTCNLDTDRAPEERYHVADDIHEVCVKGENEGIFYNCGDHDPTRQEDPAFLEQLERFDIFGR
jgi:tetratricopeptide (TPR) repeat protein